MNFNYTLVMDIICVGCGGGLGIGRPPNTNSAAQHIFFGEFLTGNFNYHLGKGTNFHGVDDKKHGVKE
jgi:hypothetical protein